MTYSEKLQHPKWQKKRLEIMSRDGFQCVKCSSETNTLTVHHFYYISGRMPWEYPSQSMVTFCKKCHLSSHKMSRSFGHISTSWELSAGYEIQRQIQLSQHEVDLDLGVLSCIERAGQTAGWPPFETMHLLKDAAQYGIITAEWLADLSKQVIANRKQQASNQ
jgi:hypothetical protein